MRQNYSPRALQEILSAYNFGDIRSTCLFTSGFENSNHCVETDREKFVIKIFEGVDMSFETIRFEAEVMDRSFSGGARSPQVLKNIHGSLTTEWNGKLAIVMPFIDGENAEYKPISNAVAKEAGEETGKMDTALEIFTDGSLTRQKYEFDGKNFLALEDKVKYLSLELDSAPILMTFERFRALQPVFSSLPTGLIHNDVVLHNLLVKDGHLAAIVDFSDMAFSPYIQNVAVAMAQLIFTYNWEPQQAKIFIDGYRTFHTLSNEELGLLYDLTLCRYAICVVELNYWNRTHGIDAKTAQFVLDNYSFLERFMQIGQKEFNTLIGLP